MKSILVFGSYGMLGTSVMKVLSDHGSPILHSPTSQEVDVSNELAVRRYIQAHKADVVLNLTAMRDVDGCEREAERAYLVNALGAKNVSLNAKRIGAYCIQVSTDYVFDGEKAGSYLETDPVNPLGVYGQTKLQGEDFALENGATVARVQWLYGQSKNNFILWLVQSILKKNQVAIATKQTGGPSSTYWVAMVLTLMFGKKVPSGVYHIAHDNFCTRWENAAAVAKYMGVDPEVSFRRNDASFGVAKRPMNTCLSNEKLKKALDLKTLGTWEEDLQLFLRTLFLSGGPHV